MLVFFNFCQVIGTPSFLLLSVMRPSLQKYWRSTKYSTRKCSIIHTLPVICSHSVLQCLLQTTSLQIIANAINIKSLLFVILQQKISGSHPAGTLCKLHATKKKRFRIHIIFRLAYSPTVINLLSNSESCEHQILHIPKICIPRSYIIVPICQQVISLVYSLTICQIFVGGHPGN